MKDEVTTIFDERHINSKNTIVTYKLIDSKIDFEKKDIIKIDIKEMCFVNNNQNIFLNGEWKITIEI